MTMAERSAFESEMKAWRWLMSLPRLDWKENSRVKMDQQVLVKMSPGKIHTSPGAPFVSVLLSHPSVSGRFKGTGNTLMQAAAEAHRRLWEAGVCLHGPDWPDAEGGNPSRQCSFTDYLVDPSGRGTHLTQSARR